jgi:hypothetical protein
VAASADTTGGTAAARGGATFNGSGGATFVGSGGATFNGSGGATFVGSGGATFVGSGGATFNGSGGATFIASTYRASGGSAITIPWVATYGGVASTTTYGLAGAGGLLWRSETTYSTSTSTITLLPSQGDALCVLDSHCAAGFVCKVQDTSPELAALGIGHCVSSTANLYGAGGAYLN